MEKKKESSIETKKTLFPIEDLELWKRNPRAMDEDDKDRLKKQLLKHKQYKPLLITLEGKKGIVIGGNMRLTTMRELVSDGHEQFKKVWVSIVDAPDDETKLEYALSDNDRAGHYNTGELATMLSELPEFDLNGYNIDAGSAVSLEQVTDWHKETEEDDFDADEEAAKIDDPVSKIGTVGQLGDHRLMCGSATSLDDVRVLTEGAKMDMVFTDPPYNVDYSGRGKKTSNKILNDKMSPEEFLVFLTDTFASYRVAMKEDASMYVCYASSSHREFENAIEANEFKVKSQIIWVKAVASMGWGDYRWKHEPILYCSLKGKKVPFYGDRSQYSTWETKPSDAELLKEAKRLLEESKDDETTVWRLGRDSKYEHPTQKPLQLIERALKNSSEPGENVMDLFGGSGSTLMACQQLGRRCYSMELDPKYVDVIVARWERFTQQKAVQLS